jgi:ferredoxin
VVRHGIATQLSKEQALERIDLAAGLGLVCQALWVQVERFLWGLSGEMMNELLEICFCCPCCCAGLNLCLAGDRGIKSMFTPSGWTAVCDRDLCDGCGRCAPRCPQGAISFRPDDGKQVIDQETCMGCGICRALCPNGAIKIKQTMPMRESLHAYFLEEGRLPLR